MNLSIIVAYCINRGIGFRNKIPWNISSDLKHFRFITTNTEKSDKVNAVIMGRNTWESIGAKPLKGRINFIVSKTLENKFTKVHVLPTFSEAIKYIEDNYEDDVENIFAIGGEDIYREALCHPKLKKIFVTEVMKTYDCDRFFPYFEESQFSKTKSDDVHIEKDNIYTHVTYVKK